MSSDNLLRVFYAGVFTGLVLFDFAARQHAYEGICR